MLWHIQQKEKGLICCNKRFHEDERDAGDKLEMQFLKPKPTSITVLEDTATHLPVMSFVDIIARPMVVQWNLSIADMLYSGHLSIVDTFPENG